MARESKNKISGIYKITNMINGKSYIGQSNDIKRRWKEHRSKHSWKSNHVIYRAFKKYGFENFKFEIIEECDVKFLSEKEKYYIAEFDTYKNGYNETEGGEGISGFNHSEETKQKLSEMLSGENNPNYGIPMSEEQKKLRSDMFKGRVFSEEHKQKLSEAKIGLYERGNHPKAKKVEYNGEVFECVKDCAEAIGESYGKLKNWLSGKDCMPQKYIDLRLRYYGDTETIYYPQTSDNKAHRVICDGIIYESAKKCGEAYGVKSATLRSWLNSRHTMPKKFIDIGLAKYEEDITNKN